MTEFLSAEPNGATPLTDDEREGLLPSWIATRPELNIAEQQGIIAARLRLRRRRLSTKAVLDDAFARSLHRTMFGEVWSWAGTYRKTERNIGIDWWEISVAVRDLMDDARLWTTGDHPMPVDHAACRFHHRLVEIHPFPNGNGRHAREMTDLLLRALGASEFTWGRGMGTDSLTQASRTRTAYIAALRAADERDYGLLREFVRS